MREDGRALALPSFILSRPNLMLSSSISDGGARPPGGHAQVTSSLAGWCPRRISSGSAELVTVPSWEPWTEPPGDIRGDATPSQGGAVLGARTGMFSNVEIFARQCSAGLSPFS